MLTEETQEMTACLAAVKMVRVDDAVVALEAFSRCFVFFHFYSDRDMR